MPKPGLLTLEKWDRDLRRYIKVTRKGKVFDLDGRTVELFSVGVFAEALDRTAQSVQRWHKEKLLPPPMFKVPNTKTVLWYSRWQIRNIQHIYRTEYDRKNRYFKRDEFLTKVRSVWYNTEFLPDVKDE